MENKRKKDLSIWWISAAIVLFIINIRVEAAIATPLERTIDGLVGGILLLTAGYFALKFFDLLGTEKKDGQSGKGASTR